MHLCKHGDCTTPITASRSYCDRCRGIRKKIAVDKQKNERRERTKVLKAGLKEDANIKLDKKFLVRGRKLYTGYTTL